MGWRQLPTWPTQSGARALLHTRLRSVAHARFGARCPVKLINLLADPAQSLSVIIDDAEIVKTIL